MRRLALMSISLAFLALACRTPEQDGGTTPVHRFEVTERGQDFTTYSRVGSITNSDGSRRFFTNSITLVENGLNYQEAGIWKESRDQLALTSDSAVAQQGAVKATLSRRLGGDSLFDLHCSDGSRCRGTIRSLRVTDPLTGQSTTVAEVKTNVPGELIAPNQMLYRDAFDRLDADVLLTWKHSGFSQEVLLHETPNIPENISVEHARLEVLTQMLDPARTNAAAATLRGSAPAPVTFGKFHIGPAVGFHSATPAQAEVAPPHDSSRAALTNTLQALDDGRNYLIQSLPWTNLTRSALSLTPARATRTSSSAPMAFAAPAGSNTTNLAAAYVIRSPILVTSTLSTFLPGQTYVIPTWYYSGQPVSFGNNCVIKFGSTNSYMLLYGTATFPLTGPGVTFTSKDDDLFGETVPTMYDNNGAPVVEGSDGWAYDCMPTRALWFYFVNSSTTVRNARFRWAQTAIRYDFARGANVAHSVSNVAFENCSTALQIAPGNSVVNVSHARVCNVQFPASGPMNGSLANDCDVVNASAFPRSQQEPAIAVRTSPANPGQMQILVVAMDQYGINPPGLLRMVSPDGGATWIRTRFAYFADARDGFEPASTDSDPEVTEDNFGNFYLAYSSQNGTAFYFSSDGGLTWKPVPGFDKTHTGLHMPRLAAGPSGKGGVPGSIWITKQDTGRLSAVGTEVHGLGDVRSAWSPEVVLANYGAPNPNPPFPTIAIGPKGQVAVMHVVGSGRDFEAAPVTYFVSVDPDGLGPASFTNKTSFQGNLGWEEINAANEVFPFASLGWDRARDRLYAAYPDKSAPGASANNTDISVRYSNDAATSWSGRIQVNDVNIRSRFQPRLAVDQSTGYAAVWWYDCRNDPQNVSVNLFAAVSTDLFATPAPRNFQMNPKLFQGGITAGDFKEYMNGKFFHGWFYPVWLDSSNSTTNNPDGTNSFDIYLARLPL